MNTPESVKQTVLLQCSGPWFRRPSDGCESPTTSGKSRSGLRRRRRPKAALSQKNHQRKNGKDGHSRSYRHKADKKWLDRHSAVNQRNLGHRAGGSGMLHTLRESCVCSCTSAATASAFSLILAVRTSRGHFRAPNGASWTDNTYHERSKMTPSSLAVSKSPGGGFPKAATMRCTPCTRRHLGHETASSS